MPKNKPTPGPSANGGRRDEVVFSGPVVSSLLARSDLPKVAKFAVAGATALAIPAVIAIVLALVGQWLGWSLLQWAAVAVSSTWLLCTAVAGGFVAAKRSWVGAVAAGIAGAWAWLSGAPFFGGALLVIAVGLAAGAVIRWWWDRNQEQREARLEALPNWERDELGGVAERLDPEFGRKPGPPVVGDFRGPAVRLLAAVCKPLHGSTVIAGSPAVAVNGSRVAVLLTGVELADAGAVPVPPLPRLPEGARARVFVLREGTELDVAAPGGSAELSDAGLSDAGLPDAATSDSAPGGSVERPRLPGTGDGGVTEIVASEPQELAAYLGGGTPPDGDATDGVAADLHSRVLKALDDYPGQGELQQPI